MANISKSERNEREMDRMYRPDFINPSSYRKDENGVTKKPPLIPFLLSIILGF